MLANERIEVLLAERRAAEQQALDDAALAVILRRILDHKGVYVSENALWIDTDLDTCNLLAEVSDDEQATILRCSEARRG